MNSKTTGLIMVCGIFLLLFWFSDQVSEVSQIQSDNLLLRLDLVDIGDIDNYTPEYEYYDNLVRKGTHFFIFMILGGALSLLRRGDLLTAFLVISLMAVFDEVHQSFVGRGASISDVLLDMGGGFAGWFIAETVRFIFRGKES